MLQVGSPFYDVTQRSLSWWYASGRRPVVTTPLGPCCIVVRVPCKPGVGSDPASDSLGGSAAGCRSGAEAVQMDLQILQSRVDAVRHTEELIRQSLVEVLTESVDLWCATSANGV